MAPRRLFGCVLFAALASCAWTGCKDKDTDKDKDKGVATGGTHTSADLMTRCEQLGKACGDTDKHAQKIVEQCKLAAKEQVASGCTEMAIAAYDCYLKELCGKSDKVWSLGDLGVLSQRHRKCVAQRDASHTCVEPEGT